MALDRESTVSTFQQQIKQALADIHDPLTLRRHPLAHLLPPSYLASTKSDPGQALLMALREAIERLRPAGPPSDMARRWRPYNALRYRYLDGMQVQEVMRQLCLSERTFYRAYHKGLERVTDFFHKLVRPQYLLMGSESIPRLSGFVGREEELAHYRRQLDRQHFAAIVGLAGVGKTSLGAELASDWQHEGPVIWLTLCQGRNDNLEAMFETLALALAALGKDEYWHFLRANPPGATALPQGTKIRYLINLLGQRNYLLCLDDAQLVNRKAALVAFCADLSRGAQARRFSLLVMSRETPAFVLDRLFSPLQGLAEAEARQLLLAAKLPTLSEDAFGELYRVTQGSPLFLRWFVTWVRSQAVTGDEDASVAFIRSMAREPHVQYYLLREVESALSDAERRFLACVSLFRTPFDIAEGPVIELLRGEGVKEIEATFVSLTNKQVAARLAGGEMAVHPLIREYFGRWLRERPEKKAQLHRRVGEYYEQSAGDVLEAGHHYFEAGDAQRAARLLSENVPQLINAGRAEASLEQLERLAQPLVRATGRELRFEVAAARETLCHLLGQRDKQRAALDTLLVLAEELGDEQRLAVAHNRRARFHEATGDYPAVIRAAKSGLEAARQTGDESAEAQSLALWGKALWRRGDYAAAREQLEQAQMQARAAGQRRIEAESLNNLGTVCFATGDYAATREHHEQALALHQALGYRRGAAQSLNGLGSAYYAMEDYAAARRCYAQALAIEETLCDRRGEAGSLNNLGLICRRVGDYATARVYHAQSLAIWQSIGDQQGEATHLNNLGLVHYNLGDYAAARECYERSLAIGQAIGDQRCKAVSLNNLGRVCYVEGDYAAARIYHERSLSIRRAIGDLPGTGHALTYLGAVLEGLEDLDGAEAAYREALAIRREIGQAALAIEDVAGLGRVALARERKEEARRYAEECLAHVAAHGVADVSFVFDIYLTCVHILEACGDTYAERAREVLDETHILLMQQADKISDAALRRSFLEKVPAHRELLRKWERVSAPWVAGEQATDGKAR